MSTDAEIAWAAGLFEGEGSFTIQRHKKHSARQGCIVEYAGMGATLQMTDKDVVERFARILTPVHAGHVREYCHDRPGAKPLFHWSCKSAEGVCKVIVAFYPWLGARRQAAVRTMLLEFVSITEARDAAVPDVVRSTLRDVLL